MVEKELQETPHGRLGIRARQIVEMIDEKINRHRKPEQKTSYPNAPSASDFAELMRLEVACEMVGAQIEIAETYSTTHKYVLERKLEDLQWEIAKRDLGDEARRAL